LERSPPLVRRLLCGPRMKTHAWLLVTLVGCASPGFDPNTPLVGSNNGKADGYDGPEAIECTDSNGNLVEVTFTPNAGAFDVQAQSADGAVFSLAGQRPSLNALVEDGGSDVPNEFVDFRASGQVAVPPLATPRFEIPLVDGDKALVFDDGSTKVQVTCQVDAYDLESFLGIAPVSVDDLDLTSATAIGFDIDDTLLFSTPAFTRGFATGGTPAPSDTTFWTAVNGCDPGCGTQTITLADGTTKTLPANDPSGVKAKAAELVAYHQALGQQVYAITARPDINGDALRDYLVSQFGFQRENVFFEPVHKTDRMAQLGLDVFYGDSDSDITDARSVTAKQVTAIRFLRSPKSSNRSSGRLAKYHPGYYGEAIIAGSYE
jgi:acid phosphatase (class B)